MVGFADLQCGFAAVGVGPALDEPAGMAEALSKCCYGLVDACAGLLSGGYFAQDGVDHAGSVGFACGAAEFDTLAEGGVGGDAIEVKELEGSETESDGDGIGEALVGALEKSADAGVEGDLPAEDAHDEGGGEVAIFGGECVDAVGM